MDALVHFLTNFQLPSGVSIAQRLWGLPPGAAGIRAHVQFPTRKGYGGKHAGPISIYTGMPDYAMGLVQIQQSFFGEKVCGVEIMPLVIPRI
jgi:hypothetical protein